MDFLPDGTFYIEDPAALKIPETSAGSGATATLQGPGSGRPLPTLDTSSGFIDDGTLRIADPDALAVPDPNTWPAADPITPMKPISGSGSNWEWDWEAGLVRETWMNSIQQDQHAWEKIGKSWDWLAGCCGKCKASANCGSQEFHSQPNQSCVNEGKGRLLASQDHMDDHDIAISVFAGLIASSSVVGKGLDPSIDPPVTTTTATPPGGIPKRNDPDPPIVEPLNGDRALRLDPFWEGRICGPDITDRFVKQLVDFMTEHPNLKSFFSQRAALSPYGPFDYKFGRNHGSLGSLRGEIGDRYLCPRNCDFQPDGPHSLTLCGLCIDGDIPGNIALGTVTFPEWMIHLGSTIMNWFHTDNWDSPSDNYSIKIGAKLRDLWNLYKDRDVRTPPEEFIKFHLCNTIPVGVTYGPFRWYKCAPCPA